MLREKWNIIIIELLSWFVWHASVYGMCVAPHIPLELKIKWEWEKKNTVGTYDFIS